jgi:FecR protein
MTREPHPSAPGFEPVDALLQSFVEQPVPPPSSGDAREMRAKVIARMEDVRTERLSRSARFRERAPRIAGLGAIAAAVAAVVAWKLHAPHAVPTADVVAVAGQSRVAHDGAERPLVDPDHAALGPSDELRTGPEARASARLGTGAAIDVGPSSRLRFAGAGDDRHVRDRIELFVGHIDVDVPRLLASDELRIVTGEATIVVHGTKFSVDRSAPEGEQPARTRVAVIEGRVGVYTAQGERLLAAGADWMSATVDDTPDIAAPAPAPAPVRSVAPAQADPSSTLKAENAALADAMRLAREHRDARALARLDDLLARHPSSPLAETARLERVRILQGMGSTAAARREAERYLADFPNGSARQEMTQIIAGAKAAAP